MYEPEEHKKYEYIVKFFPVLTRKPMRSKY